MRMRLYLNCFLSSGHSPQYIISETDIEYTYMHLSLLLVFLKYFLMHLTITAEARIYREWRKS